MEGSVKLSIIIVNWNVRELLENCLTSVQDQLQCPSDHYEIIVVDNASSDDSVEMIKKRFPDITLVEKTENLGFAGGCNEGFKHTTGTIVLMLNPDTVIRDHPIDKMLGMMERDPTIGAIGPRMVTQDLVFRRDSGGYFPTLWNVACQYLLLNRLLPPQLRPKPYFLDGDPAGSFDIDWVSGAGMMLRREALPTPVFNEDFFMFGEDMDLCDRLHQQGWRVLYTSEASIIHHYGKSMEKQSSIAVLQMLHKGPRLFFRQKHNRLEIFLYDLMLLLGYLIRWLIYGIASILRPKKGYDKLSQFSRQYVSLMISLIFKNRDS